MKAVFSLTILLIASFLSCMPVSAETVAKPLADKSAVATAETFLAGYLPALGRDKNSDFVAKSKLVTPEFKATFKKAMADKELETDPVIYAQDVPITPFKTESSKMNGDTATVVVAAKYNPKEISRLKVTLAAKNGLWLISKIDKVK